MIGVAILPFSLLGALFFGIGLLGLSPFPTALVLGWRGRRVYQEAPPAGRLAWCALGLVLFFAIPAGAHLGVAAAYRSALGQIVSSEPGGLDRGVATLRLVGPLVDPTPLVEAWTTQKDEEAKAHLAKAYRRVFGESIEDAAFRD